MPKVVIIGNGLIDLNDTFDKDTKIYIVSYSGGYDAEYPENTETVNDKNILDFYKDNNLEEDEDNIVFVDCSGVSKNYIDVMYTLQTARLENRIYTIHNPLVPIKITSLYSIRNYNLFEGEKFYPGISKGEKSDIKKFMKNCSDIIYEQLKAGFHSFDIKEAPPGWSVNLASKELNLVLYYYGLFPEAEDYNPTTKENIFLMNPVLEYIRNAQYRKIVLDALISIVSNFCVRNEYIDVTEIDDWYNFKSWKLIGKKL